VNGLEADPDEKGVMAAAMVFHALFGLGYISLGVWGVSEDVFPATFLIPIGVFLVIPWGLFKRAPALGRKFETAKLFVGFLLGPMLIGLGVTALAAMLH